MKNFIKISNGVNKKISPKVISLVFGILVLCFAIGFYVLGWVEPSGDAPEGNVPLPLNTSDIGQSKVGWLHTADKLFVGDEPTALELSVPSSGYFRATGGGIFNTGGFEVGLSIAEGKVGIGTLTPATKLDIFTNPASTNTVEEMIRLTRKSQGVVQAGSGSSINFWLEVAPGTGVPEVPILTGEIENVLTGTADLDADLVFYSLGGGTLYEVLRLHQTMMSGRSLWLSQGLRVGPVSDNTLYVTTPGPLEPLTGLVGIGTDHPQSRLQVDNGYLQIDRVAVSPPAGDCSASVVGRMVLGRNPLGPMRESLYICGARGWEYVELTNLY